MTQPATLKNGLGALLSPEDSILVLIDHQPFQFANLHSHEPTMIVNNVVELAKAAKVFNVPTLLTTVLEDRGGKLIKGLQDVFPEQKPIDRTWINAWEDPRVVQWGEKGRPQETRHRGAVVGNLPCDAGDPGGRRRLRSLRRDRRIGRGERRGTRDGHTAHGNGGRGADHLDGRRGRMAARLGSRRNSQASRRHALQSMAAAPASLSPGSSSSSARRQGAGRKPRQPFATRHPETNGKRHVQCQHPAKRRRRSFGATRKRSRAAATSRVRGIRFRRFSRPYAATGTHPRQGGSARTLQGAPRGLSRLPCRDSLAARRRRPDTTYKPITAPIAANSSALRQRADKFSSRPSTSCACKAARSPSTGA